MRILLTADLHYNHPKSRPVAEEMIEQMNTVGGDVLVLIGDTAVADGDWLEQCLARFRFAGPKLFVAGNHELWTRGSDSYSLFTEEFPRRVANLGWQWLETQPFVADGVAIVGSVGWYDYTFAAQHLQIPRRFYEAKISPGAAERFSEFSHLFMPSDDVPASAREVCARWNDGKLVMLGRSDEEFLGEILQRLDQQLSALAGIKQIIACVHHVPLQQMLPPAAKSQWDFAKAFLGSQKMGDVLLKHPAVKRIYCGHSHFHREIQLGEVTAINIGSGYREKRFEICEI